ncbi:hypothetical protein SAMN04487829_1574 [Pseudobutyrivibrio sp. NOR37]|uniref:ABC transporter permease n=1 Tax=Pseudobutyrivibrio xylanivorans TaxID=185007 RepID=A0A6M0LJC6_PSEXY|nr:MULTISPECIES: ABC transporter permease [Pseudobutyrivibrio]NEX01967.1 ABC transporter permease [Pseudobutyrivibrio xylanivorans]SFR73138.1 hypothetical protein SAMN04487829_1574 [Pseudobutyrivibrio sp. NOR37]
MLAIEFKKIKRSWIVPLIFIAPILVVASGISNLSQYFTPEYTSAWPAMFIQSALAYAYYLLPLSMIVVCVLISARETQNNGILKMLALPVDRAKLSLAKFAVVLTFLFLEILVFFVVFLVAGKVAISSHNITEDIPILYLVTCCAKLFLTMIPAVALMWAITVVFEKPIVSVGLNIFLVLPGILVANTGAWILYPYCYSGYFISCSLRDFTTETDSTRFQLIPFLPCAVALFALALAISVYRFGKKEMA